MKFLTYRMMTAFLMKFHEIFMRCYHYCVLPRLQLPIFYRTGRILNMMHQRFIKSRIGFRQ